MYSKVFIVDDDEISVFLTEETLVLENFSEAYEGFLCAERAVESIKDSVKNGGTGLPELIFLDLNMPVMSGWDFLDALAPIEEQLKDRCSIYILTSSVDVQETKKAESYSLVAGFLQKPLGPEVISEIRK